MKRNRRLGLAKRLAVGSASPERQQSPLEEDIRPRAEPGRRQAEEEGDVATVHLACSTEDPAEQRRQEASRGSLLAKTQSFADC